MVGYFNPRRKFVGKISVQVNYVKLFAKLTVISSRPSWNIMGGLEIFAKKRLSGFVSCMPLKCLQFGEPRLHVLGQQIKPC